MRRHLESAALIEAESIPGVRPPFLRFHPTLAPILWADLEDDERQVLIIARRELPNLLQAVDRALDAGDAEAIDFVAAVNKFLRFFGLTREAARLRALERLAADHRPPLRLGQVFFCAPDEDVRTFKDTVNRYPHQFEQRTLLVSPDDQAVFLSQWKHRQDRVGYVPPITIVKGIDTIEVGGFGLLEMGHGYFAESGPIVD